VSSNDPANPKTILILKGEVIREVDVAPRAINFGKLRKGQSHSKDLAITLENPKKIQISNITINNNMFSIKSKGVEEEGKSEYEVKFLGSDKLGNISATIRIELKGTHASTITVPVRVRIDKDLNYTKSLYFVQRNGSYPSREVFFTTLSGSPVNILDVEDTGGLLKTSILNRKGSASVLKAEVADSKAVPTKRRSYKLIITTDHKEEPRAEVFYSVVLPRQR
jgi:hypothetical protein